MELIELEYQKSKLRSFPFCVIGSTIITPLIIQSRILAGSLPKEYQFYPPYSNVSWHLKDVEHEILKELVNKYNHDLQFNNKFEDLIK